MAAAPEHDHDPEHDDELFAAIVEPATVAAELLSGALVDRTRQARACGWPISPRRRVMLTAEAVLELAPDSMSREQWTDGLSGRAGQVMRAAAKVAKRNQQPCARFTVTLGEDRIEREFVVRVRTLGAPDTHGVVVIDRYAPAEFDAAPRRRR
ncbi:hypothetical protein OMK64_01840 [Cellulomonas fimi]|uniref:hypothetical protein n=1 Tax=Cellulomonas fimi TaxID=1708 RepID=UPI00234D4A69|nr:hypothetical protein [Cellulomonas fimi]MDC7120274.1 hypothetical protein [Cellulomonas fimi]